MQLALLVGEVDEAGGLSCTLPPPADYAQHGANYYKSVESPMLNFTDAKDACEADGGYLIMFKTEDDFTTTKALAGKLDTHNA